MPPAFKVFLSVRSRERSGRPSSENRVVGQANVTSSVQTGEHGPGRAGWPRPEHLACVLTGPAYGFAPFHSGYVSRSPPDQS